jgi:catechol 2,3-dioxygenase-like lactoylglutathione lyase family enzyme
MNPSSPDSRPGPGSNPGTDIVTKIIFPVVDMVEAIGFYRVLGFEVESYDGGYAWVRHRGEELLHLALVTDLDTAANRAAGYFHVQDAAAWHAAWSDGGVAVEELIDQPWAMREFRLHDPAGNLLRVGQNL